jgi:phosphatidate cytidylyltransferase
MASAPTDPARWRDLPQRVVTAVGFGALVLAAIWLGPEAFTALLALGAALLSWEWVHLNGGRIRSLTGAAVPATVLAAGALGVFGWFPAAFAVLLLGFGLVWWLARFRAGRDGPAAWLAAGVLYIGLAGLSLIALRAHDAAGQASVLFLVLVVWASDIGAYAVGRALGGPRLWPAISPSKTWAGAAGGLLAAMLAGLAVAAVLGPAGVVAPMAAAALLGTASQAGDLLESAIKRHFRVKDSSDLLPGHGGAFDRLDGVLGAAPVAALLGLATGPGRELWAWGV